ncbi:branched-chain amino acid aminotransferase [Helicobacter cetorum]|uniref:Branched-chain-amino-acid aminotransferase n=1 Tax=Helicobacter cetorum (strain ATCC BAA-429 / MIT 00-7128) TaxID=182217 RepID=I0EKS5_HELC0|nr:branched-chain amino acid aminotransferase [Helicobacter cetorum]AFI03544.1 branched-chain amino acid aminotransferase [Helicobacter cetorum MIT 00-7128]
MIENLDWENLGFSYIKTDFRFVATYKNGSWSKGELVSENILQLSEASPVLHYGQACFEGLKAYRSKDNKALLFRPLENAKRLQNSCERLLMPKVSEELFLRACVEVVQANIKWLAPYKSGASLYLRPFVIGIGDNLGVKPASEYLFSVFCVPVGAYFKGGIEKGGARFITTTFDRAAPKGTGGVKVGGNYAASLLAHKLATQEGYDDCIYLDPITHSKIEEVGAANFFGITQNNCFVTPHSPSILPSITRKSLMLLAKEFLNLEVKERDVFIDELGDFKEAGACGTAAVITPIKEIRHNEKTYFFETPGKVTKQLYDLLLSIQQGEQKASKDWVLEVC